MTWRPTVCGRAGWTGRDDAQLTRAAKDPRHQMALVFRWYLGMSSRWARIGDLERKRDYQIWSGPSMGAFNDWDRGTRLEPLEARGGVAVADALLTGAAVLTRSRSLAPQGVSVPGGDWRP